MTAPLQAVFVDANDTLGDLAERLRHSKERFALRVNRQLEVSPERLPEIVGDAEVALIDHTFVPTEVGQRCANLKHIVFLGTGARSYMNPEALAEAGITVHTIRGYGDTAVAECAFALMWAAARSLAQMDRGMRAGQWLRLDGMQLTGKTLGIVGFGGIGAEMARLALGCGMEVLAWNRTPKVHDRVSFVSIDELLARSHVVSMHLLLNDETRGFLSRGRIAQLRPGSILVNTARGALVDEDAMVEALRAGQLAHAALDVYTNEPLPADHVLTTLPNVTLSAHSAFRTPEANENLIRAALDHCRRIAGG